MMEQWEHGWEPDMICKMSDETLALKVFDQPPQIIRSTLRIEVGSKVYFANIDPDAWDLPGKECPNCKGHGRVGIRACNHCGATGRVP